MLMVAKKFVSAKQLGGKKIITNKGEEIGKLVDLLIDENTGEIEAILAEPVKSSLTRRFSSKGGDLVIPYKAVFAVGDVIVVDESLIE